MKHDKQVIHRFHKRLHRHERKLEQLKELQRIYALSPIAAILSVFREDPQGALNVAACESSFDIYAANGQYLGLFQMGSHERATYATIGYSTPYQQAVAAHNYFLAAGGWGPWECVP